MRLESEITPGTLYGQRHSQERSPHQGSRKRIKSGIKKGVQPFENEWQVSERRMIGQKRIYAAIIF